MDASQRTVRPRWIRGAIIAGCGIVVAYLASEQGWMGSLPWSNRGEIAARTGGSGDNDADESPDPDVLFLPDVPDQNEPDDVAPEPDAVKRSSRPRKSAARHSQWSESKYARLTRDDAVDETDSDARGSRITTVGFEEEAPAAPVSSDESAGPGGETSAAKKDKVAARPTESTKAVSTSKNVAVGPTPGAPLMDRKKIEILIDAGDYVEAQKELSRWYWQMPAERAKILPELNKMAQALYFSPQPQYYDPYVVKPGDQLRVVGQRYKLSWEYIAKLNRVEASKIRAGQKLKIVPGPFAATVSIERYELVVHLDGSFVKNYRVGVGKDGTTPVGTFTVKNKMTDPTYYGPEGVIAHDDPNNPLGERWIDIGDSYGIHGTIDPKSIGKNESRGCIRMLNSDVEEVYDFLVIGSEVKIQK